MRFIILFLLCFVLSMAKANDDGNWSWRDQVSVRLGVGMGEIETPIALHDDRRLHWLPQLSWYGERLYFDNGLLGFALSEQKQQQWDAVAYVNDDGMLYRLSNDLTTGILMTPRPYPGYPTEVSITERPERHLSTMLGFRYAEQHDDFSWSVQAASDVSDVHHGWEVLLRLDQVLWSDDERWQLNGDIGLSLKSGALVHYYYMPQADEMYPLEGEVWLDCDNGCVQRVNGPYRAQAGWRLNLGGKLNYKINDNWSLTTNFRRYWLSSAITVSPLVTRDHYDMWFLGIVWGVN